VKAEDVKQFLLHLFWIQIWSCMGMMIKVDKAFMLLSM